MQGGVLLYLFFANLLLVVRYTPMKRKTIRPVLYTALSVLIPAVLILAALAGLKVAPFGDHTLILSDGNGLYINFLAYVGRTVKGQEGLLFSFEKGLGGNLMGSWGWFLLNPLFSLFALFDIAAYPQAFTYVSLLNFCFCGFTMYLFLKELYGHRRSNLIFSASYALCGFLTANVFQMNFFTGVQMLPLMALGLRRITKNRNPLVYILSLAYSLLTNFYFGFMLCTASALFFLTWLITDFRVIEDKRSVIIKYVLSSLMAGASSAVVWLPALLSLRGGRLGQSIAYAISFKENMPFLEMASKLFTGANSTAELVSGLPNIFVGILPVALVILFFLNKKVDRRRKTAAAFLLVFYLITFYIPAFNLIMHGGTTTNWFNYRDSFVFSFLLLVLAAEEWQHFLEEPIENLKKAALLLTGGIILVFFKSYEFVTGGAVLLDLALLSVIALAVRMYRRNPEKNPQGTLELVVLVLISVNLFMNYRICTKNILDWETTESKYQATVVPVSALVDAVKMSDSDFYRMEIGEQRSGTLGNDPMLYGYNGVGHGGSDDRDFVRTALSELGVHRFDMRNYYGKGIPAATDSLLGLKYIISKEDLTEEKCYDSLVSIGEWTLYKNPDVLPVAFLAGAEVGEVENDLVDIFENLNRTWSAVSGEEAHLFDEVGEISFTSRNMTDSLTLSMEEAATAVQSRDSGSSESASESQSTNSEEEDAPFFKELPENRNCIEYTWIAQRDGPIYCYNASGMAENRGNILPSLLYQGYYHEGETVTGYLPVSGSLVTRYLLEEVAGRFRAAYVDLDALHAASEAVRARPCTIEKLKDSHLRGDFTAESGQELMFTIPFDEGWTCFIDGKEAEINMVLDVFMAVDAPEGTHSYEMKFFPTGMKTGIGLSTAALLTLLIYIPVDIRRRKRKLAVQAEVTEETNSVV